MSDLLSADQIKRFEAGVASYQPNPEVLERFKRSDFVVIAGPAAAGKDTLRNMLLAMTESPYSSIVSTTSRPPRPEETDGQTYHFVDAEDMYRELENGVYFQVDLVHRQQLSALHVDEIKKLGQNKIGLSILVVKTERDLRALKSNIRTIFLIPPSLDTMLQRLRDERDLTDEELKRRMHAALQETAEAIADENYYCIISDGKEKVRDLADNYLRGGQKDSAIDRESRTRAKQLTDELSRYLAGRVI